MESEKPHRSGIKRRSSDFFLCFSSRSSSSSRLKVSSRSMLSPGRGRESAMVSLSSSLSRRLRNNGSMKGGQGQSSPMFPTGSKKKGCSFETQEPSSPKVTCIGQVRVKTKKKKNGRKMRTRSKRRSGGGSGEVSFRKVEDGGEGFKDRNQRWVHLPLTICEALRGFGAEFNCFSPCGGRRSASSWCNSEREKADKRRRSSCGGAVFARWLFAIDGEEKREKEMHLEEERRRETCRDGVREIEMEISEEDEREEMKVEAHKQDEEDEEARVSICIPPKNALLLMRCRSEPFRTSSLANRFWDSPAPKEENVNDNDDDEEEADGEKDRVEIEEEVKEVVVQEEEEVDKVNLEQTEAKMEEEQVLEKWVLAEESENQENPSSMEGNSEEIFEEKQENPETEVAAEEAEQQEAQLQEEIKVNDLSLDLEVEEKEEEMKDEKRLSSSSSTATTGIVQSEVEVEVEVEVEAETEQVLGEETETEKKRKSTEEEDRSVSEEVQQMDGQEFVGEPEKLHSVLPDCLLLMMCEPKLSMEVSKETWVCSTDFIRGRHNPEAKSDGGDEKKRLSTDGSKPAHRTHPAQSNNKKPPPRPQKKSSPQKVQPPRASCSEIMGRASGPSVMASMIEKKLVNAVAYEPLVLTRCKSEPMRSSAKLAPEACFWKNRKLEPHPAPPPGLGVGAAGVGF